MTNILELAALWDTVLLLDKADVFLEARSLHDLERNAMVGVFLRLLEYHQRVMFLTTNRVTTLDEAFKSRISLAIRYHDLDESVRKKVWERFLAAAGVSIMHDAVDDGASSFVTETEPTRLAELRLNRREIKNATRTAQSLALTTQQALCYESIRQVLDIVGEFDKEWQRGLAQE